jgi:hypothetical protein
MVFSIAFSENGRCSLVEISARLEDAATSHGLFIRRNILAVLRSSLFDLLEKAISVLEKSTTGVVVVVV